MCLLLGNTNNPSDSVLSIHAKRTEGGGRQKVRVLREVCGGKSKRKEEQQCYKGRMRVIAVCNKNSVY